MSITAEEVKEGLDPREKVYWGVGQLATEMVLAQRRFNALEQQIPGINATLEEQPKAISLLPDEVSSIFVGNNPVFRDKGRVLDEQTAASIMGTGMIITVTEVKFASFQSAMYLKGTTLDAPEEEYWFELAVPNPDESMQPHGYPVDPINPRTGKSFVDEQLDTCG